MAGNPLYARLGLTVVPQGTASTLALTFGGLALSDPQRTGLYGTTTQLGVVAGGTEIARFDQPATQFQSLGSLLATTFGQFGNQIRIGNLTGGPASGMIRWTGTDFEGYNGTVWQSFTATGTGTVTSVGLSGPTEFSISGSPVTTSGTLGFGWVNQSPNLVLASPAVSPGTPLFRQLVPLDLAGTPATNQILQATSGTTQAWVTVGGDASLSGGTLTLVTTGVTAGTYGSASQVGVFTVDSKGRLTSANSTTITIPAGQVTGLAAIATSGSASDLITGTVPNARLSAQVVLTTGSYPDPSWIPSLAGSKLTGPYTASGLTVGTSRLLGRTTAGSGAAEEIVAGPGLSMGAGSLDVNVDNVTIQIVSDTLQAVPGSTFAGHKYVVTVGDGSATSFVITHSLNTRAVICSVRDTGTNLFWLVDLEANTVNQVTLRFSIPPSLNQFEVTVIG